MLSVEKLGRYKTKLKEKIERRERLTPRNKVKSEKHLRDFVFLRRPMNFAKTPKLRFRVGDLNLPERRKKNTSSRENEKVGAQMCPCGKAIESRTRVVR